MGPQAQRSWGCERHRISGGVNKWQYSVYFYIQLVFFSRITQRLQPRAISSCLGLVNFSVFLPLGELCSAVQI